MPAEASSVVMRDSEGQPKALMAVIRDVTERKRTEEALRQSERRFRNYFEQGLIGMAATSSDKGWLQVNDRICDILGYSKEELYKKTWAELTCPEDLAKDVEQFHRLLKGEIENYTLDKRFIRKDGSVVYTTIHIRAFRKEDQSLDHIVALIEDVTARIQAQISLKESEARYHELIVNQGEGLGVVDRQERFTFANPAGESIFGVPQGTLVGRSLSEFMSQDQYVQVLEQTKKRQAGEKSTYELEIVRPDGETRYVLVTAVPRLDKAGQFIETFGLFFDITERKQAAGGIAKGTPHPQTPAAIQRPRTATHRLRNP